MSDVSSGARAPDGTYGLGLPPTADDPAYPVDPYATPASTSTGGDESKAKQAAKEVAGQGKQAATQAASEVKDTAVQQAQRVGSEAKTQVRNVAGEVRTKVSEQARTQNDRLVGGIRQAAEELERMRGDRPESPAATIVSRVADSGRQFADYLETNGPEGVLTEVQDFARRRPGTFLAAALAAGFVVGRLGKGVAKADDNAGAAKPATDSFSSTGTDPAYGSAGYGTGYTDSAQSYVDPAVGTTTGYTTGSTEYAATGTGTPLVVDEEYPTTRPGGTR